MLLADSPVDVSLEDVVAQLHSLAGTEGGAGPRETECEKGVTMAAREVSRVKFSSYINLPLTQMLYLNKTSIFQQ